MIYSSERNRSSRESTPRKRPGNVVWALFAAAAAVIAVAAFFVFGGSLPTLENEREVSSADVQSLWNQRRFEEVVSVTEEMLAEDALYPEALLFNGLSRYFLAMELEDEQETRYHLNKGIPNLRRALLMDDVPHRKEAEYTLGLSYFELGEYYIDLAVNHLENAVEEGFSNAAVHEYLGLAYREFGDSEQSLQNLQAAADIEPRNVTDKAIAEIYYEMGRPNDAREYLDRVIAGSEEAQLVHEARLLMGRIHLEHERFEDAYRQFNAVLEENPNSADAQYYLGEYYYSQDDSVRARAHWRNAVNLDSGHLEALERLNS